MEVFHFYEILQLWGENLLQVKLHDPNLKIKAYNSFLSSYFNIPNTSKAALSIGCQDSEHI